MSEMVTKKIMRYIVPFSYGLSFDEAIAKIDGGENSLITFEKDQSGNSNGPESDVYDYVRNEFKFDEGNNKSKVGCSYRAKLDANNPVLQLVLDTTLFSNKNIGDQNILILDDLGLLIGRNGVGFLWYEIGTKRETKEAVCLESLEEFQNQFKELCRNDQKVSFWNRITVTERNKDTLTLPEYGIREEKVINNEVKSTFYYEPFSMGIWIAEILSFLQVAFVPERKNPINGILNNAKKKDVSAIERANFHYSIVEGKKKEHTAAFIPDKSLLFTYLSFETQETPEFSEEMVKKLIRLGNGYKSTYAIKKDTEKDVFKTFENIMWYTSQEGCACFALPDEKSKIFMETEMLSKVKTDYFTLYLKSLFQSYSLLMYAERIQNELSAVKTDYVDGTEENAIGDIESDINLFLTKSMATSVSHISHQSDFYIYVKERLHIKEDVDSVTAGLNALSELQKEKIQDLEAQRSDRIQTVMGLFSILAIGSALFDTYSIFKEVFSPEWNFISMIQNHPVRITVFLVVYILVIAVCIVATTYTFKAIRSAWGKNKGKKK